MKPCKNWIYTLYFTRCIDSYTTPIGSPCMMDWWWLRVQSHGKEVSKGHSVNIFFVHFDLLVVPFLNLEIVLFV